MIKLFFGKLASQYQYNGPIFFNKRWVCETIREEVLKVFLIRDSDLLDVKFQITSSNVGLDV